MRAGNPALPSRPSFSNGNESDAAVFAIGFSAEVDQADIDGLISIVAATLTDASLHVQVDAQANVDASLLPRRFLVVSADQDVLDSTGEQLGFLKPRAVDGKRMEFHVKAREAFQGWAAGRMGGTNLGFWRPCEASELTWSILEHVPLPKGGALKPYLKALTPDLQKAVMALPSLVQALERAGLVEVVMPLHSPVRKAIWKSARFSLLVPVGAIHDYLGSNIAYYFAWMNFFTMWLIVPAVVGAFVYFHRLSYGYSLHDHPPLPFFALFMVGWGVLFIKFWKRRSLEWAVSWSTLGVADKEDLRPEFTGDLVASPATGKPELVYPNHKRAASYLLSFVVTGAFLLVAFGVMLCSLNLQGYIRGGDFWTEKLFHIPRLSRLSEPGNLFDMNHPVMGLAPTIVHVICIQTLNAIYQTIAHWLTNLENPKFEVEYQNGVALKRFFFEAFDCYIALFYIAFLHFDVVHLRTEIMSLYYTDAVRRVGLETLLPTLLHLANSRFRRKKNSKLSEQFGAGGVVLAQAVDEFDLPEYEQFDDYLEMVIQFGYIVLFAAAFPLCSLLSLLCNLVEMKSDLYKVLWVVQKPKSIRVDDIGVWEGILRSIVCMSILTNLIIFAYTSRQMKILMPFLFDENDDSQYVAHTVYTIEHVVGIAAVCVFTMIPDQPPVVVNELKRLAYEKTEAMKLIRDKNFSAIKARKSAKATKSN